MSSIYFFDTDTEDQTLVVSRFPDAVFLDSALRGDAIVAACADAEVISTFITTPFPREVIAKLPKLRLLCTRSVGFDHIDVAACEERGIIVCNVPDYGSHVIAEHAFALLLSTIRHIPEGDTRVEGGQFDYHGLRGMSLHGKTIGIIGTGRIGRTVARIAHGFAMHILAVDVCRILDIMEDYRVEYVELPELLAKSDIVTLHVPSIADTKNMINAGTIAQMKDGAILVNTARGSLIDAPALIAALDSGKIRYALLDVLEHEANVTLDDALVHHKNVVVTPHIAFYADDSVRNMFTDSFDSIDQWKKGETPAHAVKALRIVCEVGGVQKK